MVLLTLFVYFQVFGSDAPARAHAGKGIANHQTSASQAVINSLTAKERAWLRDHPVIRVVQNPGWPPIEFINEQGEFAGIADDYLKIIEQRLGVRFVRVRHLNWQAEELENRYDHFRSRNARSH